MTSWFNTNQPGWLLKQTKMAPNQSISNLFNNRSDLFYQPFGNTRLSPVPFKGASIAPGISQSLPIVQLQTQMPVSPTPKTSALQLIPQAAPAPAQQQKPSPQLPQAKQTEIPPKALPVPLPSSSPAGPTLSDYDKALKDLEDILSKRAHQDPGLSQSEQDKIKKGMSQLDPYSNVLPLVKIPLLGSYKDIQAGQALGLNLLTLPPGFIEALKKTDAALQKDLKQLMKELGDMYSSKAVEELVKLLQAYMLNFFFNSNNSLYANDLNAKELAIKEGTTEGYNRSEADMKREREMTLGNGAIDNTLFNNGLRQLLNFLQSQRTLAEIQAELKRLETENQKLEKEMKKDKAASENKDSAYNKLSPLPEPAELNML
jgi:hypothetical protein